MSEKEEGVELSSDEDFQSVLDVSAELFEQAYFELRPSRWGVDITVEDERLKEALQESDLALQQYRLVLDRELDVLLTALVMAMSDERLLEAPSLTGASDDQKQQILGRRSLVEQRFPMERLQAEYLAKRDSVNAALGGLAWQIVSGTPGQEGRRTAPTVILRIGEKPQMPQIEGGTGRSMFINLGLPKEVCVACTVSDVSYLIGRLQKVREELEREEAESDD